MSLFAIVQLGPVNQSVQTGHVYGYVYHAGKELEDELDDNQNHAGLSTWPHNSGVKSRSKNRKNPVHVNWDSIAKALPSLLSLRWQCLTRGFEHLPVPNFTQQHINFTTGVMGDVSSAYD